MYNTDEKEKIPSHAFGDELNDKPENKNIPILQSRKRGNTVDQDEDIKDRRRVLLHDHFANLDFDSALHVSYLLQRCLTPGSLEHQSLLFAQVYCHLGTGSIEEAWRIFNQLQSYTQDFNLVLHSYHLIALAFYWLKKSDAAERVCGDATAILKLIKNRDWEKSMYYGDVEAMLKAISQLEKKVKWAPRDNTSSASRTPLRVLGEKIQIALIDADDIKASSVPVECTYVDHASDLLRQFAKREYAMSMLMSLDQLTRREEVAKDTEAHQKRGKQLMLCLVGIAVLTPFGAKSLVLGVSVCVASMIVSGRKNKDVSGQSQQVLPVLKVAHPIREDLKSKVLTD